MATLLSPPFPPFNLPTLDVLFELFVAVPDLSVVQFGTTFSEIIPNFDHGALDWWSIPLDFLVFRLVRERVSPSGLPGVVIHLFSLRPRKRQAHDFTWTKVVSTGRGTNT